MHGWTTENSIPTHRVREGYKNINMQPRGSRFCEKENECQIDSFKNNVTLKACVTLTDFLSPTLKTSIFLAQTNQWTRQYLKTKTVLYQISVLK